LSPSLRVSWIRRISGGTTDIQKDLTWLMIAGFCGVCHLKRALWRIKAETIRKVNQRSDQWIEGGVTTIAVSGLLTISWRVYMGGKIPFGRHGPESLGLRSCARGSS
jgi:hypothetical protein